MELLVFTVPYEEMTLLDSTQFVQRIKKGIQEQAAKDYTWTGCLDFLESLYTARDALIKKLDPHIRTLLASIPIITYPSLEKTAWIAQPLSGKGYYIFLDADFYLDYLYFITFNLGEMSESKSDYCIHVLFNAALGTDYEVPSYEELKAQSSEGSQHVFVRATYFILTHEFSHFLLHHLNREACLITHDLGFTSQKVYLADQKSELEADRKAIDILLEAYKGHEEALLDVLISCTFLFTYLDAVHFIINCSRERNSATSFPAGPSHPDPMYRLARIEKHIWSLIPKDILKTFSRKIDATKADLELIKQRYTSSGMRRFLKENAEFVNHLQTTSANLGLKERKVLWKAL